MRHPTFTRLRRRHWHPRLTALGRVLRAWAEGRVLPVVMGCRRADSSACSYPTGGSESGRASVSVVVAESEWVAFCRCSFFFLVCLWQRRPYGTLLCFGFVLDLNFSRGPEHLDLLDGIPGEPDSAWRI